MMDQLELFSKPKTVEQIENNKYNEEYCLNQLEKALCLWDMRAWLKYKDRAEVEEYVKDPSNKNEGHSQFCVEKLKKLGVSSEKIIQAIMDNPNRMYKNRLVPCMLEGYECSRLKKAESYIDCACWKCTNKQEQEREIKHKWIGSEIKLT